MSRKIFIGGNWKCNGTFAKVKELVEGLNSGGKFPENAEVVISPTALHAGYVAQNVRKDVAVAVQNTFTEAKQGAWTGELTPDVVLDAGIPWTILGHSERRKYLEETPEFVAKKTAIALENGLKVILCIGETLTERESGNTMKVCISQLEPVFEVTKKNHFENVVIAYEPVWAIGTGKTATPEQAQDTHAEIRGWLTSVIGKAEAEKMRIIYGGSVSGANCNELVRGADIDGFLVGGASLKPEFIKIIQSAALKAKM